MQPTCHELCIATRMLAERDNTFDTGTARVPSDPVELRIVAIDYSRPTRLEAGKYLGFGVGDGFERIEKLEMHGLDCGNDRDLRSYQPCQRLDLAGVIHAQLKYRKARVFGTARKRQRHAPVVVV